MISGEVKIKVDSLQPDYISTSSKTANRHRTMYTFAVFVTDIG